MATQLSNLSLTAKLNTFGLLALLALLAIGLVGAQPAPARPVDPAPQAHDESAPALPAAFHLQRGDAAGAVANQSVELIHDSAPAVPAPLATALPLPAAAGTRVMWMEVTAYCGCKKCCGANAQGLTASGRSVAYNAGLFVAADTSVLPFGTQLQIPGYAGGEAVEVIDRGSAIRGHRIDVYFPTHEKAKAWGRRWIAVTVLN